MARVERVSSTLWWLQSFYAMAYRQVLRFLKMRSRVVNSILFPIVWLVFFGIGWASAFNRLGPMVRLIFGGLNYLEFLAPGIVVMTAFIAGFGSGLGVLFDREFGYLKEILVAPASRTAVILGRMTGDTIAAGVQAAMMLLILVIFLGYYNVVGVLGCLIVSLAAAFTATAMGTLIALMMSSPEGFHLIVNLLTLPLLFLSGAFYPITTLPEWMKILALVDPLTYPIELARYAMYGYIEVSISVATIGLLVSLLVFTIIVVLKYSKTYVA